MSIKQARTRKSELIRNALIAQQDAHQHHPLVTKLLFEVLNEGGVLGAVTDPVEMTLIHNIMLPEDSIETVTDELNEKQVARLIGKLVFAMGIQQRVIHTMADVLDGDKKIKEIAKS